MNDFGHSEGAKPTMVSSVIRNVDKQTFPTSETKKHSQKSFREQISVNNGNTMELTVWAISGKARLYQEFQRQLTTLSQELDKKHLFQVTNRPGESGLADVVGNKLIRFSVICA